MNTTTLTRDQQRRMKKLADRVDKMSQADRRFFERFPHRRHRVRLASTAEIEQFAIIAGVDDLTPPFDCEHYIIVRNVAPGFRLRRPFTAPAGNDCDVEEVEAQWLYETRCSEREREFEAALDKAAEART